MSIRFGTVDQVIAGDAEIHVRCAPQAELFQEIPERSVQAMISDPPYARKYWGLYTECGRAASRILVDHGDLMLIIPHIAVSSDFAPVVFFPELKYRWTLCLDQRNGSYARLPNNHRHIACAFKMVGWWYRPAPAMMNRQGLIDMQFTEHVPDGPVVDDRRITSPPSKELHPWEQSRDWARHCLSCLFHESGVVVDPMVGTGTLAVEAVRAGYRVICGDNDPRAIELTHQALAQAFGDDLP